MPKNDILAWDRKSGAGSITASVNCLDVTNNRVFPHLEVFVASTTANDFYVECSTDNSVWRLAETISVSGTSEMRGYLNAYPFVRVRSGSQGTNEVEVVASG